MANKKRDVQGGLAVWTAVNLLWGAYANFTTARDLAHDASSLQRMMADLPLELPWLLAAAGIIALILIWRFWDTDANSEPDAPGMRAETSGPQSPIIQQAHAGTGHNIGIGNVQNLHLGPPNFEITDELADQIASHLDSAKPVAIVWRNKKRGNQFAQELEAKLANRGFRIGMKVGFGEIPGVRFDNPITISPDGFRFGGMAIAGGHQAIAIETDL